ncbi:hypothetical protein Vadar_031028 [Vaccinium darrowii]|uniref:Uncharacterized protein n=1 Tax=Vaccinium darrowii TaxID=229202 RepID=A0ACB7Z814_9ERIC|nr:hypothetical protein Vadar_031028 [Vaccinium darrowii]
MQKLLLILMTILLMQVFADAVLSNSSLAIKDEGIAGSSLLKKYHPKKINCNYACLRRCRQASRKNVCNRACKTCCMRCHCVPPGTYGNKSACPCYASLKTHGNKPKCP